MKLICVLLLVLFGVSASATEWLITQPSGGYRSTWVTDSYKFVRPGSSVAHPVLAIEFINKADKKKVVVTAPFNIKEQ